MFLPRPLTFKRKVNCFCSTTFVLSHCIWSRELLLRSISWWISPHRGWCRFWRWHFYIPKLDWVAANSLFALQQYYFVEVDFAKCFYTTSVLCHCHCLWSRELRLHSISWWIRYYRRFCCDMFTFLHFYFSSSARLTAGSGFTLHQYYFIEVDLVNCFCTTSVLFHWQLCSSRSAQRCLTNFGIALRQFFLFRGVWPTSGHLSSELLGSTKTTRKPQKTYMRRTPVPWTFPVIWPEAKPKTSRNWLWQEAKPRNLPFFWSDYGKRPNR